MRESPRGKAPVVAQPNRRGRSGESPIWPRFVWASTLLALSAGFLVGGALFLFRAIGTGGSEWQAAAAQAHGHVQIFGWGGLMALGIGLHFVPRLLSAPLAHGRWPGYVLVLMTSGLVLRIFAQPILSTDSPHGLRLAAAIGCALAATFELTAGLLVVLLIVPMIAAAGLRTKRVPSRSVGLLILTAFVCLMAALAINWIGSLAAAARLQGLVSARADGAVVLLGLTGFLSAISLAMSARLFPLYVQTRLPRETWLRLSAVMLLTGVMFQAIGITTQDSTASGFGQILTAVAFVCGIFALRVFEPRRQLPRRRVRVITDPLQLHLITAYAWLLLDGVLSLFQGVGVLGAGVPSFSIDAERHALGAGFITLLILGVGSEMLPGLSQARLRRPQLKWLTLVLANAAVVTRVVPILDHSLLGTGNAWVLSVAGLLGAAAIIVFLVNVPLNNRRLRDRKPPKIARV